MLATPERVEEQAPAPREDHRRDLKLLRSTRSRVGAVVLVVLAVVAPFALSTDVSLPMSFPWASWLTATNQALLAAVGAAAFSILLGYTHQISVAHAAFLMLGSVSSAWFGILWGVPFVVVIVLAAVVGALVGIVVGLPALRFRGLYLLIATFAVHFIALFLYQAFQRRYFGFSSMRFSDPALPSWTHGLPGIELSPKGEFLIQGSFRWYWVLLPVTVVSLLLMTNVLRSSIGRSFKAIAEYDTSASLIGINVTRTKLQAFALSSAFVSVNGAMASYYLGARGEDSFPFGLVLSYAIIVIVGGFGSVKGAVLGSFFYYLSPVMLSWLSSEAPGFREVEFLQDYQSETNLGLFGVLVIAMLLWYPAGLTGLWDAVMRRLPGGETEGRPSAGQEAR